jgi:DNA-binding transcriptional ArsR family regulator
MPRPTKKIEIPYYPIKSISEQLEEGKSHAQIGEYFDVSQDTISRRIKKEKDNNATTDTPRT